MIEEGRFDRSTTLGEVEDVTKAATMITFIIAEDGVVNITVSCKYPGAEEFIAKAASELVGSLLDALVVALEIPQ